MLLHADRSEGRRNSCSCPSRSREERGGFKHGLNGEVIHARAQKVRHRSRREIHPVWVPQTIWWPQSLVSAHWAGASQTLTEPMLCGHKGFCPHFTGENIDSGRGACCSISMWPVFCQRMALGGVLETCKGKERPKNKHTPSLHCALCTWPRSGRAPRTWLGQVLPEEGCSEVWEPRHRHSFLKKKSSYPWVFRVRWIPSQI